MIGPALSHDPLPGPKTKTLDRSYRRKKKRSSKVEGRNRSTMFGSFFQQSRLDRLLDLIPIKSSLQIAPHIHRNSARNGYRAKGCIFQPLGRLSVRAPSARNRLQLLGTFPTRVRLSRTSPAPHLIRPLQENTSNSDGGSDGHQGRRTFVTEY
ncbi:hypothetical protein F2Q70_00003048 [Brassica cretica]|uniref:Uncharacterized protein n=1 Tax=Brassica cretica TaxID=69181 RepID=A0A8S9IQ50_BRACR|nr:hypothetical protein F2Q70_00003048 [Brassica cretica]